MERTRSGLGLLGVGAVLLLAPVVGLCGVPLVLLALLLLYRGRRPFGPPHTPLTLASLVLALIPVTFVLILLLPVLRQVDLLDLILRIGPWIDVLRTPFLWAFLPAVFWQLAYFLATWGLQESQGKWVLVGAFTVGVVTTGASSLILGTEVLLHGPGPPSIDIYFLVTFLTAVPVPFYLLAFGLAFRRIERRAIPGRFPSSEGKTIPPAAASPAEGPVAAPRVCPRCGYSNQPTYQFCVSCSAALPPVFAVPPAGYPAPGMPPMYGFDPYAHAAYQQAAERERQVNLAKPGLLLLAVGSAIEWVPVFGGFVGGLLVLIGGILFLLGRKAFGERHARNAMIALALFIVALVGGVVAAVAVVGALFTAFTPGGGGVSAAEVAAALRTTLVAAIPIGAISAVGSVLFTHELQRREGRILLYVAAVAMVAVGVAVYLLVLPVLEDFAAMGGTVSLGGVQDLQSRLEIFSLLYAAPALLYAITHYLVWSRIKRGEIPATPPVAPAPVLAPFPPAGPVGPPPPAPPPPGV